MGFDLVPSSAQRFADGGLTSGSASPAGPIELGKTTIKELVSGIAGEVRQITRQGGVDF
jgi:hypothetical protein